MGFLKCRQTFDNFKHVLVFQMHSLYELQCAIMVIGLFVSNVFFSLSLLRLYVYRLCAQFDFEILRINRYKQMWKTMNYTRKTAQRTAKQIKKLFVWESRIRQILIILYYSKFIVGVVVVELNAFGVHKNLCQLHLRKKMIVTRLWVAVYFYEVIFFSLFSDISSHTGDTIMKKTLLNAVLNWK